MRFFAVLQDCHCAPLHLALFLTASLMQAAPEPMKVPVNELGKQFILTGKLGTPLGKVVTVQGVVRDGPLKGYEGGLNLWVQRIGGEATQERIRIPLSPYFGDWADTVDSKDGIPKPESGASYEMSGYETGRFVGIPSDVLEQTDAWIQTTDHYLRTELKVFVVKKIQRIEFTPADFKDRKALFSGSAQNRDGSSWLNGNRWSVVVDSKAPWPPHAEGKLIEVYGFFDLGKELGRFTLRDGVWRLVRLEDQVGSKVELRGRAIDSSGDWWFEYRGSNVQVPNMAHLPNWEPENHFRPIIIRGILERIVNPLNTDDPSRQYTVRNASWEPLPGGLLTPEVVDRNDFESE